MQTDHERENQGREPQDKSLPFLIPARIPIFPLPNTVFFPKTYLPLHIFEPRYRQMVTDAAMGGQCIGMVLLKEGWESDYYGNPPIFAMGCVGRIVSMQPLVDGRSNILLQGLERYEIQAEHFDRSYREATIRLTSRASDGRLDPMVRTKLVHTLEEFLKSRDDAPTWQALFREEVSDDILINSVSTYLECTPLEKQFLLEAESLQQQARRLGDLLHFMMHDPHGAKGWG